jgi:hypothetical protein
MQSHYVCSECGFTSKLAGTCQNDNCIRQGTRLLECHCTDGLHQIVRRENHDEITENIAEQNEDAKQNDYSVNTLDLDNPDASDKA